jgi:hypothetical protein
VRDEKKDMKMYVAPKIRANKRIARYNPSLYTFKTKNPKSTLKITVVPIYRGKNTAIKIAKGTMFFNREKILKIGRRVIALKINVITTKVKIK